MIKFEKQLEYIRSQLAWIKSKVELDNQLGLYDINKLGENIFMHILNDVYDWNLKNANLIDENFPAIDLVDDTNKIVIQVTSTITSKKLRNTIEKFKKLKQYSDYKLKIFYIKEKPNFNRTTREYFEQEGISSEDLIGIDDIINIIQEEPQKCQLLYNTIQQKFDVISFKFNIESYFEQFEPHLQSITSDKFKKYENDFKQFIESENKVLEIHSVGGNGKSHLLRYLALIETNYIPLIFTKQINIEEDLRKLDKTKKYLFIVDDIDRFLEQPLLLNLLSYTLSNQNIKLMLSYRTPSKSTIETIYRKYTNIKRQEINIIWNEDEIKSLIWVLIPSLEEHKVLKLAHTFNKNPYLITQAIKGNLESIKDFSKKILDDTIKALQDFNLSEKEISDLLFELALITPISKDIINEEYKPIISRLVDSGILRELAYKYRFNPDMIGDLYLANYIDKNKDNFKEIVEQNLNKFSDTVFTNLSYALIYNKSDSLQSFIKQIIQKWIDNEEYKNEYLALINKIVYFAPMESFIYLQKATNNLIPKEENNLPKSDFQKSITTVAINTDTYNSDNDAINLESIEPIISKLIYALKNNIDTEELKINHIIDYLSSDIVLSLPKPYYDNQTLESIFKKIISPLDTQNFDVILEALNFMEKWIEENPLNNKKILLLQTVLENLFSALFEKTYLEGFTVILEQIPLNLKNKNILNVINRAKDIIFKIIKCNNEHILHIVLDIISMVGGYRLENLDKDYIEFYSNIKIEFLEQIKNKIVDSDNFYLKERLENILIKILEFSTYEPLREISLDILREINRNDEYLFYLFVKRRHYNEFTDNEKNVIIRLSNKYKEVDKFVELINLLDMSSLNAYYTLSILLNLWYEYNNIVFSFFEDSHFKNINNQTIQNVIKEILLLKGLRKISLEDITDNSSNNDLKVYIDVIFKNCDDSKIKILEKIVKVIEHKKPNEIQMFIAIISQRLYFTIADENSSYYKFEQIILKFLKWQLQYKFSIEAYLTHHILYDIAKKNNLKISQTIIKVLKKILEDDEIKINEFELKPIYKILNFGLNECIDVLYKKVTLLKKDRTPKYIFTHYFDSNNISEVILLKSFVNSYKDFEILINRVWDLCSKPVVCIGTDGKEHKAYVNLDYFFKYTILPEYINKIFNKFYEKNEIDKVKFFYKIVPVSFEYIDIIVNNLNLLVNYDISEDDLINYLRGVGKIKMYSSSPMQNSPQLLEEKKLLEEIKDKIDSLSLQLRLKEELKYIDIRKRQKIELDISFIQK